MKNGTKLLKKIHIHKLKLKIMKTLEKFECSSCIIRIQMQTTKEVVNNYNNKLYRVTTSPKRKNSWSEYYKEFNFTDESIKYFIDEIKFWLI